MTSLPEQIIAQPRDLERALAEISRHAIIGLDTEFVGEDRYIPDLCLIQVATPESLYLIDPYSAGSLDTFWSLLNDPKREVVVHAGREEIRLCQRYTGLPIGNVFDLQLAAGLIGPTYPIGHGNLVLQVLQKKLSKAETLTQWRNRPLTREQVVYAFDDVRHLLDVRAALVERLEQKGRLDWAGEEFQRLTRIVASDDEPDDGAERWRRFKAASSLSRRGLAALKALFAWRQDLALAHNRPARVLLRDDLMVEIARRMPKSEKELRVVRGVAHKNVAAMIDVLDKVRSLPVEACPKVIERETELPQVNLVVGVLSACLSDFCARENIATNLVANNADLRALVRAQLAGTPLEPTSLLASGWRSDFALPVLRRIVEGKTKISIRDLSSETPFHFSE